MSDTPDGFPTISLEVTPDWEGHGISWTSSFSTPLNGIMYAGAIAYQGPSDVWFWNPTGSTPTQWYMGSTVSTPPGTSNTFMTPAQQFSGTATSVSPTKSTGQSGYAIYYYPNGLTGGATIVGYVAISAAQGTAQWWMFTSSYTAPPYLPTPTNAKPLWFKLMTPPSGHTGWKGTNVT